MQRTLLIVLATAVVAAGVATGATILLTDDDKDTIALPSPGLATASPEATTDATASPEATATNDAEQTDAPDGTDVPDATNRATPPSGSAKNVDCDDRPRLCSSTEGKMEVVEDRLVSKESERTGTNYSGVPKVEMKWSVQRPNKKPAERGDEVDKLHVEVTVRNDTNKTFVFPKREVILDIYLDGRLLDSIKTEGPGFELTPGSKMNGKFDRPIVDDGSYTWQAKTYYTEK